jgi:hypothetical protein
MRKRWNDAAQFVGAVVVLALLVRLLMVWAQAAVTTNQAVFVQKPRWPHLQIVAADTTTAKTLFTCPADGAKIVGMFVTTSDTTANGVQISVLNTSTYVIATVTVPLSAGYVAGAPAVNLLSGTNWPGLPLDSDGNPYFYCESGDVLQAAATLTLVSAEVMNIFVVAANF